MKWEVNVIPLVQLSLLHNGSALCQVFVPAQAYGIRHRGGVLNFSADR